MTRIHPLFLSLLIVMTAAPSVWAQGARSTGEVTGLELALEGVTSAQPGATLRWFGTLYEVVGHDQLRPSRSGRLRVLASFAPDEVIADLRTTRGGHLDIEIEVPADRNAPFELMLEASSAGERRTFRQQISLRSAAHVELLADRLRAHPGEVINFIGRAITATAGRPAAEREATLTFQDQDGRTLAAPQVRQTSPEGLFMTSFLMPEEVTTLRLRAYIEDIGVGTIRVGAAEPEQPRMVLRAVAEQRLVEPGEEIAVEVMLRRADGRPVRGAAVRIEGVTYEDDLLPETDESGRVTLQWQAPLALEAGAILDREVRVTAERAGLGVISTTLTVRLARAGYQLGFSVEGGALVPELDSFLYLRVLDAEGQPAPGVPVRIESPLLGDHRAETNSDGVARIEVTPQPRPGIEGRDRCGGTTASSTRFTLGQGEDQVQIERCVPLDPDASIRLRPEGPIRAAGEELEVDLALSRSARREPIELMLLAREQDQLRPLSRQLLSPGSSSATVQLPAEEVGEMLLRARPLVGAAREPVRGGMTTLWVTPGRRLEITVTADERRASVTLPPEAQGLRGTFLLVPQREADALEARLRRTMMPTLARSLDDPSGADGPLLEGWLASRTPRDEAAPAVLRGREVVVIPAPDRPVDDGVLRDPVRARARFVRGRLALVVRSIEDRLEEVIPDNVGDVGLETRRGWRFNRETLDALIGAHYLVNREPTTLGGERLTLADLEALDRSFTFDNLARRVTRKRLLGLLIHLRNFVRRRELDLWQESDDPSPWLEVMVDETSLARDALRDGWGRPMAIRRAPGGRARFRLITPLPDGWELVSSGPDGRFGTGDDLADPFARVLPSGSAYAEAVGEDALLTRLERVELSQATIDTVTNLFEIQTRHLYGSPAPHSTDRWTDLLASRPPTQSVDHFERPWLPIERRPASLRDLSSSPRTTIEVDDEPRGWSVIALVWTRQGWMATARADLRAGFPVILSASSPGLLRPEEPLLLPVTVARLPEGPSSLELAVDGDGPIEVASEQRDQTAELRLDAGGVAQTTLRIEANDEGEGTIRVEVRDATDARRGRTIEVPFEARAPGSLRVQSAAAVAGEPLQIDLPRDAEAARGRLVVARPTAFLEDPALRRWHEQDPALLAWALTIAGQELPPALLRQLEEATSRSVGVSGVEPMLSTACAAVAWAATTEGVRWARRATVRRVTGEPDHLRAAILAAVSIAAGGDDDALSRVIATSRDLLRSTARHNRADPSALARGAAALLLADHRDVRGRTMLALAREHLTPGFRGGLVVDPTVEEEEDEEQEEEDEEQQEEGEEQEDDVVPGRQGRDQVIATAALALAAHQAGEAELARQLGEGLAARAHVATSLGGEPLFWLLAARAFGVYGIADPDDPPTVTVTIGREQREVELGAEAVTLPLELPRPGRELNLRVATEAEVTPLVTATAHYLRPAHAQQDGPLEVELTGDPGLVDDRAAFQVVINNAALTPVELPRLLITLPAGAVLDETARSAMTSPAGVLEVEPPDGRGVVRVVLDRLEPGTEMRLPLPLIWTAAGRRQGPAIAAFPADRSWELTIGPPAELDVRLSDPEDDL